MLQAEPLGQQHSPGLWCASVQPQRTQTGALCTDAPSPPTLCSCWGALPSRNRCEQTGWPWRPLRSWAASTIVSRNVFKVRVESFKDYWNDYYVTLQFGVDYISYSNRRWHYVNIFPKTLIILINNKVSKTCKTSMVNTMFWHQPTGQLMVIIRIIQHILTCTGKDKLINV